MALVEMVLCQALAAWLGWVSARRPGLALPIAHFRRIHLSMRNFLALRLPPRAMWRLTFDKLFFYLF
jgi:hypothetical protein